jgi:GntR family transcriptional repressor for pyruvate dehydrogenase complex
MHITPIQRVSLVGTVAEQIRGFIEQGPLKAGDRLPSEAELARQLGVSRSVVREALGRLETMGLLSSRQGRGSFVGNRHSLADYVKLVRSVMALSPRELLEFVKFRRAVECYAAREAALLATADDLAALETLLFQMDRPGQEYRATIRLDFEFHRKIVNITGNQLMRNVMGLIHEIIIAIMEQTTSQPRDRRGSRRHHRAIFEAIRAGDPEAAESAMRTHLDGVVARVQQMEPKNKQEQPRQGRTEATRRASQAGNGREGNRLF